METLSASDKLISIQKKSVSCYNNDKITWHIEELIKVNKIDDKGKLIQEYEACDGVFEMNGKCFKATCEAKRES